MGRLADIQSGAMIQTAKATEHPSWALQAPPLLSLSLIRLGLEGHIFDAPLLHFMPIWLRLCVWLILFSLEGH